MNSKTILTSFFAALALAPSVFASFHLMQVEQVIGGVDGDTSAQAIQLRMRAFDQDLVSQARVRAWDSSGGNPVLILNITSNVPNSAAGSRILLATAAFTTAMKAVTPAFIPDFTMSNPIPASYLAAGRLTFESDAGEIFWSFAWGGAGYTGSHTGEIDNDANGNFGPAFAQGLPTTGRQGVRFKGPASAPSTANAADYALSSIPATVIKNNGTSFVIGPQPEIVVEQPLGSNLVDGAARKSFGTVKVGGSGKTKTFTIRNTGSANLTGLKIRKTGANPNGFILTTLAKTSLAPGDRVKFKVTFKPNTKGTRKATIHIKSNDADENPFDIKLTGLGVAP